MEQMISVVTPAFNSVKTIAQTIESVLDQTAPCLEYFIIDGGSQDGTVELAHSYDGAFAAKNVRYTVVSEKDNGIYDAMNKGIRMASGVLVGIINSDDWYEPCAMEIVERTYREAPFDMMYANLRMWRDDKVMTIKKARKRKHYVTTRDWNHPTTFITKEVYKEFSYACETIYDDLDLWLRIIKAGKRIVTVDELLANYRLGGSSNTKTLSQAFGRARSKYRIYRDNGFSRLYLLEAVGMEAAKFILA